MKKMIIPAILAAGVFSSAWAMEKTGVFYTGDCELKVSDASTIKFSDLMGYQTKADAEKKENGVLIGVIAESQSQYGLDFRIIDDAHSQKCWWTNTGQFNHISRITIASLGDGYHACGTHRLENVENFAKRFNALSSDLKANFLQSLGASCNELMENCEAYSYDELIIASDIIGHLKGIKELSNTDKAAMFIAYSVIRRNMISITEDLQDNVKYARKMEFFSELLSPSIYKGVCFAGIAKAIIANGDCLNFSNLIGYKTEENAIHEKDGFVIGILCECRSGMTGSFLAFVLPEFADQDIWVNTLSYGTKNAKDVTINLALADELWTEFKAKDEAQKAEYLDGLITKASEYSDAMDYSDIMLLEWSKNAVETSKHPSGKAPENVYKIIVYCIKLACDNLAEYYKEMKENPAVDAEIEDVTIEDVTEQDAKAEAPAEAAK